MNQVACHGARVINRVEIGEKDCRIADDRVARLKKRPVIL